MRPSPASLARSKPGPIVDLADLGILRRDQHQPVAEQVDARVVLDELLLRAVVHPFEIGGDEHVGRRALLDLLRQRGACGVARHHLDAGRLGEGRVDVVERVLHRGGGEDRDGLVLRGGGARRSDAPATSSKGEKADASCNHGGSPSARACARERSCRMLRPSGTAVPDCRGARTARRGSRRHPSKPRLTAIDCQAVARHAQTARKLARTRDANGRTRRRSRANTTTSSSARARPAACWPTGCRPIRATACCCSKPAASDNWIWFHIPVGYLFAIGNPRSDWMFKTEPEPGLNGRALNYPRGKVIGGSSAINAMIYMRGQAADYDHWRQLGLTGWGWDDVLPFFKKHERPFPRRERASRGRRRMAHRGAARALGPARRVPRGRRAGRHQADRRLQHAATTKARAISTSTRGAAGAGRRRAASSSRC